MLVVITGSLKPGNV